MSSDSMDTKKIFELTDVYEDQNSRNNQEVIMIDGRGYEKDAKDKNLHNTMQEVEGHQITNNINEEIIQRTTEIAERIAREIIPEIAERIVRDEIEKLKKISGNDSMTND